MDQAILAGQRAALAPCSLRIVDERIHQAGSNAMPLIFRQHGNAHYALPCARVIVHPGILKHFIHNGAALACHAVDEADHAPVRFRDPEILGKCLNARFDPFPGSRLRRREACSFHHCDPFGILRFHITDRDLFHICFLLFRILALFLLLRRIRRLFSGCFPVFFRHVFCACRFCILGFRVLRRFRFGFFVFLLSGIMLQFFKEHFNAQLCDLKLLLSALI